MLIGEAVNNAGDLYAMSRSFGKLSELTDATGVTLILNHHLTKAVRPGVTPGMHLLTGAGVGEWGRQFLLLNRIKEYVPDSGRHELTLVAAGSTTQGSAWTLVAEELDDERQPCWSVAVTPMGDTGSGSDEIERKVIQYLSVMPDGDTMRAVRASLVIRDQQAKRVFSNLNRDGLIESVEITRKNRRTYAGWRITDDGRRMLSHWDTGTPPSQ
jgi:hypothetical protein